MLCGYASAYRSLGCRLGSSLMKTCLDVYLDINEDIVEVGSLVIMMRALVIRYLGGGHWRCWRHSFGGFYCPS